MSTSAYWLIQLGALTWHLDNSAYDNFSNKVGLGLIANPLISIALCKDEQATYDCFGPLIGTNSVGENMYGALYHLGAIEGEYRSGFIIGGYFDKEQPFIDRGINRAISLKMKPLSFTPIVGLEIAKGPISLAITPALISFYFSFKFD